METKTKRRLKHPSLPYIITTGLMLIGLELQCTWELSTPREQNAVLVAATGEVNSMVAVMGRMSALCGFGAGQEGGVR